jgi:hypothetical protein
MRNFFCVILLFLTGCVATGPLFKPAENVDQDSAVLYVYRLKTWAASVRGAYFYINDVNVFDLNTDGYSWVSLPAGKYKLKQKWSPDMSTKNLELDVEVKAGGMYYFSFETGMCTAGYGSTCIEWRLRRQPESAGRAAIADKRFQENFGLSKLKSQLQPSQ